jgi:hypothetical protein
VEARQKHIDVREILLDRKQVVTKKLDAESQKLLADAKDLYTVAEAQASATTKKEEDLAARILIVSVRERAVAK